MSLVHVQKEIWGKKKHLSWSTVIQKISAPRAFGATFSKSLRKSGNECPRLIGSLRLFQLMATLTSEVNHVPIFQMTLMWGFKREYVLFTILQWVTEVLSVQTQVSVSTKIILSHGLTKHQIDVTLRTQGINITITNGSQLQDFLDLKISSINKPNKCILKE